MSDKTPNEEPEMEYLLFHPQVAYALGPEEDDDNTLWALPSSIGKDDLLVIANGFEDDERRDERRRAFTAFVSPPEHAQMFDQGHTLADVIQAAKKRLEETGGI